MNGLTYKVAMVIFSLMSAMFFTSVTFATSNQFDKTKIYRSKLGCMSCHQGESMPLSGDDDADQQNQAH